MIRHYSRNHLTLFCLLWFVLVQPSAFAISHSKESARTLNVQATGEPILLAQSSNTEEIIIPEESEEEEEEDEPDCD